MNVHVTRGAKFCWVVVLLLVVGCEETTQTASTSTTVAPPPPAEGTLIPPPIAPPPVLPPSSEGQNISSPPAETTERTAAEVGVGAKGRYDSNDYVSTVVGAYFGIQERLAFDQAQRGLNDYKTLNGDYPKTHELYWKEVIEANAISLPALPLGERYLYDYESAKRTRGEEALFVVKPKQ
jgi:hypothetical protein